MSSVSPLKARPSTAEAFSAEGPEGGPDFGEEAFLLLDVDLLNFGEEFEVDAELFRDRAEGGDVLGEAGAAVADAGTQEAGADAAVEANAAGDLFDIGVGRLAQVGDGVDEGDFEGEESVGGVLDNLRGLGGCVEQRRRVGRGANAGDCSGLTVVGTTGERRVDFGEQSRGGVADAAPTTMRSGWRKSWTAVPSPQELGVGDDVEEAAGDAVALDGAPDPLVGVDGYGGLLHDDLVAGERAGDLAGDGLDVGKIGIATLRLGGTDGDEDRVALARGLGEVGGETDARVAIALEHLGKMLLVDQGVPGFERRDFALVIIDADDVVTNLSEAYGRDQADISRTNDCNLNSFAHGV